MNENIQQSTEEKGEWGELYAIVTLSQVRTHYIFSEALVEVEGFDVITGFGIWKKVDGKDTAIRAIYNEEVVYRNEEVLSNSDILAKTI